MHIVDPLLGNLDGGRLDFSVTVQVSSAASRVKFELPAYLTLSIVFGFMVEGVLGKGMIVVR